MGCDWRPFAEIVARHQRFVLTTHVRPDGDALGSEKGMADVLRRHGKQVHIINASATPPRYAFLDPEHHFQKFTPPTDHLADTQVIIILDTGTWNQLGTVAEFVRGSSAAKVVIDHHLTQDDLGARRFVDTSAEANARLVHQAILALGGPLSPEAADALFVGLAMDTGWFRHSNVTADTFSLAAELTRAGARPDHLHYQLYEQNTLSRLKLAGQTLDRLTLTAGGKIAYTVVRRSDLESTGAAPQDSEDLVNATLSLAGVEIGLFFFEQLQGGVKVSFRSRDGVDVRRLAEQFGGGGHRQAAGATVPGTFDEALARVLRATEQALRGN